MNYSLLFSVLFLTFKKDSGIIGFRKCVTAIIFWDFSRVWFPIRLI